MAGSMGHLTAKDLVRLKTWYEATTDVRGQWVILKKEFGYKTDNGLRKALIKAGVTFTRKTKEKNVFSTK